jgi:CheY-like chemotaxis protein
MQHSGRLSDLKVMVVDDKADIRALIRILLEDEGATVTEFDSVPTALAGLIATSPDIFVVDIGMPTYNGYVFIAKTRGLNVHTPAIALTAFASSTDRDVALAAGFQIHIGKPFDPDILVAAIEQLTKVNHAVSAA